MKLNEIKKLSTEEILEKYKITNYEIRPDGSVNVFGNVDISGRDLTKLPCVFHAVSGSFRCNSNELTSLEGAPREVGGVFDCGHNQLTSLERGPQYVGDSFSCSGNELNSLEGAPKEVGGDFHHGGSRWYTVRGQWVAGPKNFTEAEVRAVCNVKGRIIS